MSAAIVFLERLAKQHFYGSVTLRFDDGKVVHIRKEESLLPESLTENPEELNIVHLRSN